MTHSFCKRELACDRFHMLTVVENHQKSRIFKNRQNWSFLYFYSKCKRSSLRSQCWMRLFLWFSTTVHAVQQRHCRLSFWSGYYHDFSSLDIPSGSFFFKKPFYFYSSNGQKRTKSNNRKSEDFTDYRSTT